MQEVPVLNQEEQSPKLGFSPPTPMYGGEGLPHSGFYQKCNPGPTKVQSKPTLSHKKFWFEDIGIIPWNTILLEIPKQAVVISFEAKLPIAVNLSWI